MNEKDESSHQPKEEQKKQDQVVIERKAQHDRLMEAVNALGVYKSNFMFELGYKNPTSTWKQLREGRQGVSIEMITKIRKAYPQVNTSYILEGNGKVLLEKSEARKFAMLPIQSKLKRIPYFRIPESDTKNKTMKNWRENEEVFIYVPDFNNCDAYVEVRTDMMHSEVRKGDIAALKKANTQLLPKGAICYVVTDELYCFARITINGDTVHAKTDNEDFPDIDIELKSIKEIFRVEGIIRSNLH